MGLHVSLLHLSLHARFGISRFALTTYNRARKEYRASSFVHMRVRVVPCALPCCAIAGLLVHRTSPAQIDTRLFGRTWQCSGHALLRGTVSGSCLPCQGVFRQGDGGTASRRQLRRATLSGARSSRHRQAVPRPPVLPRLPFRCASSLPRYLPIQETVCRLGRAADNWVITIGTGASAALSETSWLIATGPAASTGCPACWRCTCRLRSAVAWGRRPRLRRDDLTPAPWTKRLRRGAAGQG